MDHQIIQTLSMPTLQTIRAACALLSRCFLLIALCALTACSPPKLTPLTGNKVILAFGDSLTRGVGVTQSASYPAVLARLSGLTVINAGVSGETTDRGLARLPGVLDEVNPAMLILIEGGNDILRNRPFAQIKQDLKNMITLAENRGIPVLLVGVPQKKLFSSSAPFYRELADEHNLVFDGELIGSLMRSPSMKSDAIHFNQQGYREMAEAIYELLKDNGAL